MSSRTAASRCPGCLSVQSREDGPRDKYGVMSPECHKALSEIFEYEHRRYGTPHVHRLLSDSSIVQHPPRLDVQIIQGIDKSLIAESVQRMTVHLVALYLTFEKRWDAAKVAREVDAFLAHVRHHHIEFLELHPPADLGRIKLPDIVHGINEHPLTLDEYTGLITKFADSAWDAWSVHHATIRRLYEKYK